MTTKAAANTIITAAVIATDKDFGQKKTSLQRSFLCIAYP